MKFRRSEQIDTPHGNSAIWRYMSDKKFRDLLTNSQLFFSNANKLTDQYEVTVPQSTLRSKEKQLQAEGCSGHELKERMSAFHWESDPMKDLVLINCWSIRREESYALWKIYLGDKRNGVAVRTTVGSLRFAIENGGDRYPEEFFVGRVGYHSHLKLDELTQISAIMTKKPYYDFEEELRLFIINDPMSDSGSRPRYDVAMGRPVKVSLADAMQEIYVSPFADVKYGREVVSLAKSAGFRVGQVRESEIRDR